MRMAFVSTMSGVPWGGSEVLWSEACRRLASAGHQVFVSYPTWPRLPAPVQALHDEFGIDVFSHGRQSDLTVPQRIGRKILKGVGVSSFISAERAWLRRVRPELLCISSGNATEGAQWMRMAVAEGIAFVTIAQAHAEFLWPEDDQAESLISLFSAARKCFFVSHGNLKLLQTQLGAPLTNAEVVSNHAAGLWNASPPWPIGEDGIWRLACVGRLHPSSKGQDLFIEILRHAPWRARPLLISCYGAGPQERSLRRLVDATGLAQQIRFHGHVSDVVQVWATNHALILPSRYEGLPLALVEALLCGRMAIVTDVAGNAEVVEHGVTGFVAEAAAVASLGRVMEEAWSRREQWHEMGQRARAAIRRKVPEDPGSVLAAKLVQLC